MNLQWLRVRLFGPPDPMKHAVVKKIEHEVSRLNGAAATLEQEVRTIKTDREQSRQAFSEMLDEALRAMNREARK